MEPAAVPSALSMDHQQRQRSQLLVQEARSAVVCAMSPGTQSAASAVQWIYAFQNSSQHAVEDKCSAALQLITESSADQFSLQYKLFAFNSLESLIKIGWYSMKPEFKKNLKLSLQSLLSDESLHSNFLSDGSARCIVEVMMREWPQKWPELLPLMLSMPRKTSVLHVLRQLAEDIGIHFKPNNPQRRRELVSTITEQLNPILRYIVDCVQSDQAVLCLFSLKTLTAYLEWTPIESQLIRFLCHILSVPLPHESQMLLQSKTIACECLVNMMCRKKMKGGEAEALSVLFADDVLPIVFQLLQQCLLARDETSFNPMFQELSRKVCLLVTSAGTFLLSDDAVARINVLKLVIHQMLPVIKHRNQSMCHSSTDFFREIIKAHEKLQMDSQEAHSFVQELFMAMTKQMVKLDPSHVFVIHDFDSYAEYELFYTRFKADLLNLLRLITTTHPQFAAECMLEFVQHVSSTATSDASCLSNWESAATILDCVCNKLPQSQQVSDMVLPFTLHLLCVPTHSHANLLSVQLSCLSALSAFLPHFAPEIRKQLIDRIFCLAKFPVQPSTGSLSDQEHQWDAKGVRRHACSCFVKISRRFPRLLLPLFDELQQELTAATFSRMEVASLIEGLILICNTSEEPGKLKVLICDVLSHIDWVKDFNVETGSFMQLIGISGTTDPMADEFVTNRSKIQQAVSLLLALFRRVEKKSELLPHILPFLKAVVGIACNLNEMWDPVFRSMCNPCLAEKIYSSASDLDKLHLLEYTLPAKDVNKTAIDSKIQNFLWSVHESVFTVFGCAFSSLRPDVYAESACFLNTLGKCYFLPPMKLKLIVKHFLKPFVQNVPLQRDSLKLAIDPLFSPPLPFLPCWLFNHVADAWSAHQTPHDDDRLQDQVIEEQANRLLSREFADLCHCLLFASEKGSAFMTESSDDVMDVDSQPRLPSESDLRLSPTCAYLIQNHLVHLISMTVGALIWSDSLVNLKFVLLNKFLLKELCDMRLISTADDVSFILHHVFLALRIFRESQENQSALLQLTLVLYEQLAKNYGDDMRAPFWRLTRSEESEWHKFHQTLIQPSLSGTAIVTDKKKKDALRSLLSDLFGDDSHTRQKVQIKSLQPLSLTRPKNKGLIDNCDSTLSLSRLFS